uniref:Uncharacterized protein n=1 Tax=Setaria digitata TaxID=48799 RepID=A0A915PSL8_9BILA
MNQSCNDNGDEKDLNEEQIISKWNNTCLAVENKNFDGQQLKVLYEQQPHAVSKINISSLQPIGSMAVIPNHDNDNADDNDDENDEFYDASSDFNDISPSPITPSIINTASIISSTTASQADSRDKGIWNGTSLLAAVSESVESSANSVAHDSSSNSLCHEIRQARQANTARVPPMITQNVTAQRSPLFDKSRLPYKSTKSHLLSAQPDLKDIKSIVERQEAELREELSKMKSSVQGEIVNKASPSRARNSQMRTARPSTAVLASSRSIEFGTKSPVAVQSPVYHTSRLPTPVRKSFGRSLIPTPRASTFSRSAIRSLAGGSTPSLVLSSQHVMDETRSECGGLSQNEQRWADECF